MLITQENRLLQLTTTLGPDILLIQSLHAEEGLSRLFRYDLELLYETRPGESVPFFIDASQLLGAPMTIRCGDSKPNGAFRFFHGICVEFAQVGYNEQFTQYRVELVPAVWSLTQIVRSRIFQQKSVPEILAKIFNGFEVKFELQGTFEPRNYCVQYAESDWNFASRLMEDEGIFYFFEQTSDQHRLIVANTPQSHRDCPTFSQFPFVADLSDRDEERNGGIYAWQANQRFRSGKYTTWDHNFELPGNHLEASEISRFTIDRNRELEVYDYPGGYSKRFDGIDPSGGERAADLQKIFKDRTRTVQLRQQEIDTSCVDIEASGDAFSISAGHAFKMTDHPTAGWNGDYVIVAAAIDVTQSSDYVTDMPLATPFTARFSCIAKAGAYNPQSSAKPTPFRPPRATPRPVIYGSQTAVVVGPPSEEIFVDKYGRIKVQFNWDREGEMNSNSSCWIRVATSWAGKQWGSLHIPRVGMEVIVNFIDGDPDQPIVVGAVYNANNMPPYTLPGEKTISTLRSNSSTGGNGYNEFRFEDSKSNEQIFLHAQRDYDRMILRDEKSLINRDSIESIKRDNHVTVGGSHSEKISGQQSINVGTSAETKAGTKFAVDAGTEIHLKSALTTVIETGTSLTLKVGGNFININPAGIFVKGTVVMLNSGGASGSGSGAAPETPLEPNITEPKSTGSRLDRPTSVPPPPPPPPKLEELAAAASQPPSTETPLPSGRVEEAIARQMQQVPDAPSVVGPLATAVEEAREAIANYEEPQLASAVASAKKAAAPVIAEASARAEQARGTVDAGIKAAAAEAQKNANEMSAAIERAAAAYEAERGRVDEAKKLVAAYESVVSGVGRQAMSLLNAADKGTPFSAL